MTQTMIAKRPRYQGHSVFNDAVRADWVKSIELNPDRFDALLYLPVTTTSGDGNDSEYEESQVIELDSNQDTLSYGKPQLISVVDCPDESESFFMMNAGNESLGESAEPLLLRIGAEVVPIGSVLEWEEEISTGKTIRVWWYVHDHVGVGTANVGRLSICIPMRNFNEDGLIIKGEEQPPQEEIIENVDVSESNNGEIIDLSDEG